LSRVARPLDFFPFFGGAGADIQRVGRPIGSGEGGATSLVNSSAARVHEGRAVEMTALATAAVRPLKRPFSEFRRWLVDSLDSPIRMASVSQRLMGA